MVPARFEDLRKCCNLEVEISLVAGMPFRLGCDEFPHRPEARHVVVRAR
jgi:hypothetical protein